MFIYLSKKARPGLVVTLLIIALQDAAPHVQIAIPSGSKLKALSWNADHGWLACGGENGLLKVRGVRCLAVRC
jgi:hypothetical protein